MDEWINKICHIDRDKVITGYQGLERRGKGELMLNEYRVCVWGAEQFGVHSGDCCTTL